MVNKKDIKLELKITFYLKSSVRFNLTSISNIIETSDTFKKLYTSPDGFIISTGYTFQYNYSGLTIPTHLPFYKYEGYDLISYFNFRNDMQRYDSLKRLYNYLNHFSQSRIFEYDNNGYVNIEDDKWLIY